MERWCPKTVVLFPLQATLARQASVLHVQSLLGLFQAKGLCRLTQLNTREGRSWVRSGCAAPGRTVWWLLGVFFGHVFSVLRVAVFRLSVLIVLGPVIRCADIVGIVGRIGIDHFRFGDIPGLRG